MSTIRYMSTANRQHEPAPDRCSIYTPAKVHRFLDAIINEFQCDDVVDLELQPGDGTRYLISISHVYPWNKDVYVYFTSEDLRDPREIVHLPDEEFDPGYIASVHDIHPTTACVIAELHHLLIEEPSLGVLKDYEPTYYDLRDGKTIWR